MIWRYLFHAAGESNSALTGFSAQHSVAMRLWLLRKHSVCLGTRQEPGERLASFIVSNGRVLGYDQDEF